MGCSSSEDDSASSVRASKPGGSTTHKKVSCQPCRQAKVKCIVSSDSTSNACSRCTKLKRDCFYRTHKRGRKPGKIKLQQILRRVQLLDRTLTEIKLLNNHVNDADAESLVNTLQWQLSRSKFFQRAAVAHADPVEHNHLIHQPEISAPQTTVHEHRDQPHPGFAQNANANANANAQLPLPLENVQRPRSDFNMLVDMEDHASVARVRDEFPTLSNPLKLLAQASSEESERRRMRVSSGSDAGLGRTTSVGLDQPQCANEREQQRAARAGSSSKHDAQPPRKRARSHSASPHTACHMQSATDQTCQVCATTHATSTATMASSNADCTAKVEVEVEVETVASSSNKSWASTYFSRGAFHPVYDNRPEFDPIDQHLLTASQATRLISSFYASFGTFMHIFDPHLSTFGYIRKHSAFLLTVICAISAEFEASTDVEIQQESAVLAPRLRRHYEAMIAWITSGDYKNVEMAQAFFLLASYRPMADSATSDQTWLFLGTAIRIATELGCNLVCYSYTNTPRVADGNQNDHYTRQLRNTERLWINLWNLEKTLASQTGQRMHLADEGVVATCSRWHRMPCSLRQDDVLVAQVELRRLMIEKVDVFHTHVTRTLGSRRRVTTAEAPRTSSDDDSNDTNDPLSSTERDQLSLQLSYFRHSVDMDLKRWQERWLSSSCTLSSAPTPLQITGPLSLDYAALVTYALPLPISYTVDVTSELTQLYRHCYLSCTNYMATFVDRCQRAMMDHITNSTVISTVYAVVFALDLARKAYNQTRTPCHAGQHASAHASNTSNTSNARGVDFGFVSTKRVVNLAKLTAAQLDKIGKAKQGRLGRSVASRYSAFLNGVLARFEVTRDTVSAGASTQVANERAQAVGQVGGGEQTDTGEQAAAVGRGFQAVQTDLPRSTHESDGACAAFSSTQACDFVQPNAADVDPDSDHHLRRVGSHAVAPTSACTRSHAGTRKQGTKASHAYSSNLMFSPDASDAQPATYPTSSTAMPAHMRTASCSAPAPAPAPARATQSWTTTRCSPRFVMPAHHSLPKPTHECIPMQPLSPATWFNQLHTTNATPTQTDPAAQRVSSIDTDPSWEWMMADLDLFSVDGGGGGGEPILDQMARLFG